MFRISRIFRSLNPLQSIARFSSVFCMSCLCGQLLTGFAQGAPQQAYIMAAIPDTNAAFVRSSLQYAFIVNPRFKLQDREFGTNLFWLADHFNTRVINAISIMEDGTTTVDDILSAIKLVSNSSISVSLLPFGLLNQEICNAIKLKTRSLFLVPAGRSGNNLDEVLATECILPNLAFVAQLNQESTELVEGSNYGKAVAFAAKSSLAAGIDPGTIDPSSISLMCAFKEAVAAAQAARNQSTGSEIVEKLAAKLSKLPALEGLTRSGSALLTCE